MIWFDDGLLSTYTVAYPVMRTRGLTGAVAVITGLVGKAFYSKNWGTTTPCMNTEQLRELLDAGWILASHTVHHSLAFNQLTPEETTRELVDSKQWFQENLDYTPEWFVVPRHLIRPDQMKQVKQHYKHTRPLGNPVQGHIIFHNVEGPNWFRRRLDRGRAW